MAIEPLLEPLPRRRDLALRQHLAAYVLHAITDSGVVQPEVVKQVIALKCLCERCGHVMLRMNQRRCCSRRKSPYWNRLGRAPNHSKRRESKSDLLSVQHGNDPPTRVIGLALASELFQMASVLVIQV
jgi:hypothetical protein